MEATDSYEEEERRKRLSRSAAKRGVDGTEGSSESSGEDVEPTETESGGHVSGGRVGPPGGKPTDQTPIKLEPVDDAPIKLEPDGPQEAPQPTPAVVTRGYDAPSPNTPLAKALAYVRGRPNAAQAAPSDPSNGSMPAAYGANYGDNLSKVMDAVQAIKKKTPGVSARQVKPGEITDKFQPLGVAFTPEETTGTVTEPAGAPSPSTGDPQSGHTNLPQSVADYMAKRNAKNASDGAGSSPALSPAMQSIAMRLFGNAAPVGSLNPYITKMFPSIAKDAEQRQAALEKVADIPMEEQARKQQLAQHQQQMAHQQAQEDIARQANVTRNRALDLTDAQRQASESEKERHNKSTEQETKDKLEAAKELQAARIQQIKSKIAGQAQGKGALGPKDLPPELSDTVDNLSSIHEMLDRYSALPGTGVVGGSKLVPEQTLDLHEKAGDPLGILGKQRSGAGGTAEDARELRMRLSQLAIGKEKSLSSAIFRNPNNMSMMRQSYGLLQTGSDPQIRKGVALMEQAIQNEITQREGSATSAKRATMEKVLAPAQHQGAKPDVPTRVQQLKAKGLSMEQVEEQMRKEGYED